MWKDKTAFDFTLFGIKYQAMAKKDYYKLLGLNKSASADEIKAAFKKLAKQYHPDRNPDNKAAEEKFKEISEAYEVLGDPGKRQKYDQFGHFDFGGSGPQDPFSQGYWQQGGFSQVDLNEIFGDLFGMGGPKRGRRSRMHFDFGDPGGFGGGPFGTAQGRDGTDINWTLPLDFLEAANGCEKQILLHNGEKVKVKIPAGVDTGSKIRLKGKGNPGVAGGQAGDLIIETKVEPDDRFRREGDDVHVDVDVPLLDALRGGRVNVPTIHGPVELKIPKAVQSGQKMRLKDKGIANLKSRVRGHQFVHILIQVPQDLSEQELNQLETILARKAKV